MEYCKIYANRGGSDLAVCWCFACRDHDTSVADRLPADRRRQSTGNVTGDAAHQ